MIKEFQRERFFYSWFYRAGKYNARRKIIRLVNMILNKLRYDLFNDKTIYNWRTVSWIWSLYVFSYYFISLLILLFSSNSVMKVVFLGLITSTNAFLRSTRPILNLRWVGICSRKVRQRYERVSNPWPSDLNSNACAECQWIYKDMWRPLDDY